MLIYAIVTRCRKQTWKPCICLHIRCYILEGGRWLHRKASSIRPPFGGDVWNILTFLSIYCQYIYVPVCQNMSFYSSTGPEHSAGGFHLLNFGHPFSHFFRPKFWNNFRRRFWLQNGSPLEPKIRRKYPKWWSINVSLKRRVQKSRFVHFWADFCPRQHS